MVPSQTDETDDNVSVWLKERVTHKNMVEIRWKKYLYL